MEIVPWGRSLLPSTGDPDGPLLAFGGLTVAVVDFAREFRPDDGISTQLFELGMTALALTGMFLLVRSSGRGGPLA